MLMTAAGARVGRSFFNFLACSAFGVSTLFPNLSWALSLTNNIPYYGRDFYDQVAHGDRDDQLASDIRKVITSKHVAHKDSLDDVVETCPAGATCYEHTPVGYDVARKKLLGEMYLVDFGSNLYGVRDVYCEHTYEKTDFHRGPLPAPNTIPEDAVINAEHTWPQSKFNPKMNQATQKCDLHHLFPSDSEMNRIRGNFHFGVVDVPQLAPRCPIVKFGLSSANNEKVFEPPTHHKGNVARALFYFSIRYSIHIEPSEEVVLKKWNHDDPVDAEERARNDRIQQIQGNRNPFVDYPELADAISDF